MKSKLLTQPVWKQLTEIQGSQSIRHDEKNKSHA